MNRNVRKLLKRNKQLEEENQSLRTRIEDLKESLLERSNLLSLSRFKNNKILAGIPRKFRFRMINVKDAPIGFFEFEGIYELHGFGRYGACKLEMGAAPGQLQGLNPIWKKLYTATESQYFIFFNHTRQEGPRSCWKRQWELHETTSPSSYITHDRLYCKTADNEMPTRNCWAAFPPDEKLKADFEIEFC